MNKIKRWDKIFFRTAMKRAWQDEKRLSLQRDRRVVRESLKSWIGSNNFSSDPEDLTSFDYDCVGNTTWEWNDWCNRGSWRTLESLIASFTNRPYDELKAKLAPFIRKGFIGHRMQRCLDWSIDDPSESRYYPCKWTGSFRHNSGPYMDYGGIIRTGDFVICDGEDIFILSGFDLKWEEK
jgi:hypothetical protein